MQPTGWRFAPRARSAQACIFDKIEILKYINTYHNIIYTMSITPISKTLHIKGDGPTIKVKRANISKIKIDNDINALVENIQAMSLSTAIENTVSPVISISDEIRTRLSANLTKAVKGYHIINNDPIKETPWEDINAQVLDKSGCDVKSQSNGSHKPGGDLSCSLGCFSNKSAKYESGNTSFKISSYRLTEVCSDKTPGNIEDIIAEINKRKNFTYYSIIVREETEKQFLYEWYLIPSDFPALNPASYNWHPKLGKTGKNKGAITGWATDAVNGSSMSITFSMSSQLWIDVNITEEMKKFVVGSCRADRGRKYNYIDIYEMDKNDENII